MARPAAIHRRTFREGSKTYYGSSLFFPPAVRDDVYVLYGFVRVADNFVDRIPQDGTGFLDFCRRYERAAWGRETGDPIIDSFVQLAGRKEFDPGWVHAFLRSMRWDLEGRDYPTVEDTLDYIYGSAEVIGLFMAKILDLPEESLHAAKMQGRAMQYINFIRDIAEDNQLGRQYLPTAGYHLPSLDESVAREHPAEFERFIREQILLYEGWQSEAEEGYRYIPKRYLVPIKTASDMYNWTARTIAEDPWIVFETKAKPPKTRIFLTGIGNWFTL
jgi:phytoene synthase